MGCRITGLRDLRRLGWSRFALLAVLSMGVLRGEVQQV